MDRQTTLRELRKKGGNEFMADWLLETTKHIRFQHFDADENWNRKVGTILIVKVHLQDLDKIVRKTGIPKTVVANHKVVEVNLETLIGGKKGTTKVNKIRFRETGAKKGSRKPDAKTTAKQEATSAAIFELALKKRTGWINETVFKNDKEVEKTIRKKYPEAYDDSMNDWIPVFFKQHKTILDKLSDRKVTKFDHEGGFMKYIMTLMKPLKIRKKDNWNPADIWGVQGSSDLVIAKIKNALEGADKGTQTVLQLNAIMRGMYKADELIGISLKKTSGKEALWEEYNIDELTLEEVDEYRYKDVKTIINFKSSADGKTQALDSSVQLRKSGGASEYNFQITSNDTSKPNQNLKFESKPTGGAKARGGKAEIAQVELLANKLCPILIKDNEGGDFKNKHKEYPANTAAWTASKGAVIAKYKKYFTDIQNKVTTDCKDADDFAQTIALIFAGDKPWVAQSKLMQLTFLWHVNKIPNGKVQEFWTDMLFLSIKKGDRFGPFGKLY